MGLFLFRKISYFSDTFLKIFQSVKVKTAGVTPEKRVGGGRGVRCLELSLLDLPTQNVPGETLLNIVTREDAQVPIP